jgi:hypothetical protein
MVPAKMAVAAEVKLATLVVGGRWGCPYCGFGTDGGRCLSTFDRLRSVF